MQKHFMLFFAVFFLCVRTSLFATPECPIINGTFSGANGTTVDNSSTGWYLDASKVLSTGYFAVKSNRLHAQELGGEGVWYSQVFSTAGYTDWQVAVKVTSEGDMNSSEYVKVYYKINGGSETLLDSRTGNFGTLDFTSGLLNGNSVQLVVRIYNYNNGGSQTSKYYIEQYRVFKEKGPCVSSGVKVTATAANGGVLTCTSPSLTLSATSSASGTTYSWTGPNSFTSTAQNPTVSTAGTYTVTGTSSAGTGTASVTVSENKAAPDLTATGGSLACAASVTLSAASSVPNAAYSWTGPNGFTSTSQNPTVNTVGSYTVTVTNPANGCKTSQTVTVTAGNAVTAWEENFTLSNGTTADNGTTAWSVTYPSGSVFAVNNNEFKISGIGTTGEGVWTSGSITMTGKTSVTISGAVRSAVSGSAVMNDTGTYADYIRFYYKINGGSEVLFYEKKSAINNHSTTNTTFSVSVPAGNTLQIVVRARATGTDEFYYFDNVKVAAIDPAITLATAVSGPVTCVSNPQVTVTPSGTVSSYAWTGPNGFTSTTQNPVVTAGGTYTVTATLPSGCTVAATATVTENKTPPDLDANGAVLGCLTSVAISANSSVANATYSWTGPGGFTSTSKSPTVNVAGTYTVTVKNPLNGCTASKSVVVTSSSTTPASFWLEDFTFADGTTADNGSTPWTMVSTGTGTASVQSNEFKVSYTGAGETTWSSGVVDISGKSNVVISADLRSETASANDAFENDDYMKVYYKLDNGAEVLVYEDYSGIGNTTAGTARVTVSSAALNGSTLQVIIRARNSDPTERYFFDNVGLTGTNLVSYPTAVASVKDSLTCTVTSVTLSGASSVSGVNYKWTGPGSFTSDLQNPVVTAAGDYILTVTNTSTGCSSKDTVTVRQFTAAPGVTAGVSGPLSCGAATVVLSASSGTAGVSYKWTGPSGYTSALQNPSVSVPGDYTVIVTNPVNGCTSSQTVTVINNVATTSTIWNEDFALSNGAVVDNGSTGWSVTYPSGSLFSVLNNEFRISGIGTSGEGVWTSGVIDISGKTNVSIGANARSAVTGGAVMNDAGTYADYLRFYYKLNGGAEVLFAEKKSDINGNSTTYSYVSTSSSLSGSMLQLVIRARATGTDEFYYVDNVKVSAASGGDLVAVASVSDSLTCKVTAVTLSGSSSTAGVTYKWSGPGGFTSTQQNPAVSVPGDYILTVTNPATGCTGMDTVTVKQSLSKPTPTVAVSGTLSCTTTTVTLSGSAGITGATYSWSGPNGFTSAVQNPVVNVAGTYTLTVTHPVTGCTASGQVEVMQDVSKPTLSVTAPGGLNCLNTSVVLTAGSNGTITWSGYNTGVNPITVTAAGKYYVTAKGANGCTSADSVLVTQDISKPTLSVTAPGGLNCLNTSVVLTAGSNGTITWSGYNTGVNPITVTAAGKYYVTAKGANGCTSADSVLVTQDISKPTLSVTAPGGLNCTTSTVNLTATSNGTVTWSGYNAGVNSITVTAPGKYYVSSKGANGCIRTDSVTVTQDISKPTLSLTTPGILTCTTNAVNLSASSNGTVTWSGYNAGVNPITVTAPGKYYVTAKGANGCTISDSVTVTQDITKPTLSLTTPGILTCTTTVVNLSASSNGTVTWSGYNAGVNPITVTAPGKYYVTAKSANGCTISDSVTVTQDISKPTLSLTTPGILTCTTTAVNLSASSNGTVTWSGYNAGVNPITVTTPGKYYVTAKGANGCTISDSVTVMQDISKPTLSLTTPGILTCTTTAVNLSASSNGTVTWSGYNAGVNPITVTTPGKYYVTAKGANGCTISDSVTVMQDISKPTLSLTTPGILTCTTTAVNLSASSNGTVTWSGYNAGVNPITVTTPGKYYVTAKGANGCTISDSVTVTQDISKPTLSLTTPGILTCTTTVVSLSASSNGTVTWSGYNVGVNPITVTAPGKYYVTAKGANGCTISDSVTVTQDISKPTLSLITPGILTCTTSAVNLSASSNGTVTWNGNNAGVNPITVTTPGKYYVTAKGANGCTISDSVTVTQDISKPTLSLITPGILTCTTNAVNLSASSNGTVTWNGNNAGVNAITVTAPGKYYVTAKGANGCTISDSVTVTQDITKPTLSLTTPGILTCTTTAVNLNASSNGTVTWNGNNAGVNPITVTTPGKYYVTAKGANGCTISDSVTVMQDISKPTLSLTTPGILTCTTTAVNLSASTNGTVTWSGYNAGVNPITVTTPGKYYVTAKGANGCTISDSVTVMQDISKPTLSLTTRGVLTCTTTVVNLSASSNGTVTWSGYNAGVNPITVTAPGKYYVTAKGANGCTISDSVTVTQDISKPTLSLTTPGVLTCTTTVVNLSASSNGTVTWSGYNAGVNPITVTAPGKYYVTAKGANGCTISDSVTVTQDISKPTLSLITPGILTCTTTAVNLSASSNGTVTWSGYNAGVNPIAVTAAGKYYVTARGSNGCTSTDSVVVTQDGTKPTLSVTILGTLNCSTTSINITASSNGTITWSGYNAGVNPITVTTPGKYYVTAKNANGCTISDSVTVTQDISKPTLSLTTPGILTCTTTAVNLSASSNGTVTWSGYNAGVNPITVTTPGKYYVTAKSANGCTISDSVTVTQDISKPTLSLTTPGILTCTTTAVNLSASSNGTITWSGYNAGVNPITVTAPGKYYVTAKGANGCTISDSVTVTQDISKPTLSLTIPGILTCTTTAVNLSASSNGTVTWSGYNAGVNPITVTTPGKYYVTANGANGCTILDSVTVTQDISKPTLSLATPGILTCTTTAVNLSASSNGTVTWSGYNAGVNPITVTAPGKYYVTSKGANGCMSADSVTVTQDIIKPTLSLTTPGILTCTTTAVNLSASSNGTITWSGYNVGVNPITVTTSGKYYVTAKGANGCTISDSVTVMQDISKPTLSLTTPGILTCTTTAVNLSASSSGTITWSGYNAGVNPITVITPAKYYVTSKGANGCTSTDSVTVTQDISKPTLSLTTPGILTCTTTAVNLSASSSGTITWSGYNAGVNPITVTTPAKYYVTSKGANGCTSTDSVTVTQDISKPTLSLTTPGILTCTTTAVNLSATSNGTITWSGYNAGVNPITVTAPGKYYVTSKGENGCTRADSVTVTQDISKPTLLLTTPGILTCTTTVVNLSASSNGTIIWSGNNAGVNPITVTTPGKYYVTSKGANGCTSTDSVTVTQDISKPTLSLTTPGILTCTTTAVNLSATSNGTITWSGNNAGVNPITVTTPGKYYVTSKGANGCTRADSVTITQDTSKPTLSLTTPGILTCTTTAVNLSASSNGTVTWNGNNAGVNPITVTTPAKYYVTSKGANGCTITDSVTVTQDISKPTLSLTTPGILTCTTTAVNLSANSNGTVTWSGYNAGVNPITVTTPGKYYVTSKGANGCTIADSVTVTQNITPAANVQATNNGPLTCTKTTAQITGASTSTGVTYTWSGPSNFTATTAVANVTTPGTYTLVVTNTQNGCTATTNTPVAQNITPPANIQASNDGPLTCLKTNVIINGTSSTNGSTFKWTGPNNFAATTASAIVTAPGTYTLSVTNPNNGCVATTNTPVVQNTTVPVAVILPPANTPDPLSVDLLSAQSVTNANYQWSLTSTDNSWFIIDGAQTASVLYQSGNSGINGLFTLLVTDKTNGCQNTATYMLNTASLTLKSVSLEFNAYPNPFTDQLSVTFKSPVNGNVSVEIYNNLLGNREGTLFNDNAKAGQTYKVVFRSASLPAGLHYCVIRANGKVYTKKLVLVR